jgi:hypothetical protein
MRHKMNGSNIGNAEMAGQGMVGPVHPAEWCEITRDEQPRVHA